MRATVPVLLVLLLMSAWSCAGKKSPAPKSDPERCAADRDCVLISKPWKRCCRGCDPPYAVHRGRAAATERWHRINCRSAECAKRKCPPSPGQQTARCKKRRCVTEVTIR